MSLPGESQGRGAWRAAAYGVAQGQTRLKRLSSSSRTTSRGLPGGSTVKNPPAMQETWVQALGQEDPLEKGMATHSRVLAWRTPWTEEPGGLQSTGSQRVRHD